MTPRHLDPCYRATLACVLSGAQVRPRDIDGVGCIWSVVTSRGCLFTLPKSVVYPWLDADPSVEVDLTFGTHEAAAQLLDELRARFPLIEEISE